MSRLMSNARRGSPKSTAVTLPFAVCQMPQRVRPSQDVTDLGALHNPSGADPARRPRPCPLSLSTLDGAGPPDLLLQKEYAIDKRLGRGRTSRHVDIDWH